MAVVKATLASPAAFAVNNRAGGGTHFGCGETVNLGVQVRPAAATVATFGGVRWQFKSVPAGCALGAVVAAAGTAVLTIGDTPGDIELEAWGVAPAYNKPLTTKKLKAIAPNDVRFTMVPGCTIAHTVNQAEAGFIATVEILPMGVNFSNLQVIEWEFKGVGSGGFAHDNGVTHPYWGSPGPPAWIPIIYAAATGKNMMNGHDQIQSGTARPRVDAMGVPVLDAHGRSTYEAATFEWHIPWHYKLLGAVGNGKLFTYAVHKETLTEMGRVSIQKHNSTTRGASYGDPTIGYSLAGLGYP
jgi:hypothetical protein